MSWDELKIMELKNFESIFYGNILNYQIRLPSNYLIVDINIE